MLAGSATATVSRAQYTSEQLQNQGDIPLYVLDTPFGSFEPSFLPDAGCAFAPAVDGANLAADVRGTEEPTPAQGPGAYAVNLEASIYGTITDAAGNTYDVLGTFEQSGQTQFPLEEVAFQGDGRLTIQGPNGTVSGDATFVDVTEGPPEWDFYFTGALTCAVGSTALPVRALAAAVGRTVRQTFAVP